MRPRSPRLACPYCGVVFVGRLPLVRHLDDCGERTGRR